MRVVAYNTEYARIWDEFVRHSRNATFLLLRSYMDYHADRFKDASFLFLDEKEKLCGLFAANARPEKKRIEAHGGLTYGGLILNSHSSVISAGRMMASAAHEYFRMGYDDMIYKPIPHIYHTKSSQEDLYSLFLADSTIAVRAVSTVIDLAASASVYSNLRKRKIKKAYRSGIHIKETKEDTAWRAFHIILQNVLESRHCTSPVHTADELCLLAGRFPGEIRLFVAEDEDIQAGIVVYDTQQVFHLQYIAANDKACTTCALDALIDYAISIAREEGHRYFDFGISTEQGGRLLNKGLIFQKEGFGGHAVCYDAYKVDIAKLARICM